MTGRAFMWIGADITRTTRSNLTRVEKFAAEEREKGEKVQKIFDRVVDDAILRLREVEMRESESRRRCDARNDNSSHHDVKFNRSGLSSVFFSSFSCYKFHAIKIIVYWLHEITLDKISFFLLCDFLTISMN